MFHGHDYSIYSGSPSTRTGVYAWLAIAAATVSAILQQLAPVVGSYLRWFHLRDSLFDSIIVTATPLVIFSVFAWLFDHHLWKTSAGSLIFAIARTKQPPVIDGRYKGTSAWFNPTEGAAASEKGVHDVEVRIRQTWERLSVSFSFPDLDAVIRSRSHSDMAFMERSFDAETVRLQYTYSYEGVTFDPASNVVRKRLIRGTCSLSFTQKDGLWVASGQYYTDIATSGEVKLEQLRP